ncbi:transporter substrate-binding domain-containing protein [Rhizobium sp. 1399]|jgi:polar amino acid transport system substrate-binding protein|uniref:transporter substrate-binding domain-containing protein n=1 Tax=Rhizobium sp. 1399 TaxID=2817758 RepID=UPI0028554BAF|nr:transporter substrate-binding domain-containing protein [Rhizobium sp. 1399]MDR6666593.1 polar amino acid transport system substrate-binding protein [Rhizobium sp. 1399]
MHLEMKAADTLRELAPTGRLRLGIVVAPAASAFFVILDNGTYRGVTVDIGRALAAKLGLDVEIVRFPNSGACTDAVEAGAIDVSFMPVDDERRKRVAFGPAYYLIESTYLVTAASGIESLSEVDRASVRVVGITNTTTIRSAGRSLMTIRPEPVETVAEGVERLLDGRADALALSRDAFRSLLPQLPGSRVLDGGFQRTGIAIATAKDRPAALALLTDFMEEAKASGLVRKALDAAGFADEPVAPPGG